MKKNIKLSVFFSMVIAIIALLTGCGHNNPLMNSDSIQDMQSKFFLEDVKFPIKECAKFYVNYQNDPSLKTTCDRWTDSYYITLSHDGALPTNTTLSDFRSQEFWQAVLANRT